MAALTVLGLSVIYRFGPSRENAKWRWVTPRRVRAMRNTPNPVSTTMELEYEIVEHGRTELYISDMQGRKVAVLVSGEAAPGRYVLTVDATRLSSGRYVYVLETPTERLSRILEVVK